MTKSINKKLKKVKLLVLDVDGILTDGSINIDHKGEEFKRFNVNDGFGCVLLKRAGLMTGIISARSTQAVTARAEDLGFDKIVQNSSNKVDSFIEMIKELRVKPEEACFMGDDLPDLALINYVGLGITVPNAASEVKRQADYITRNKGGHGAVRETVELILKAQGLWKPIVKKYSL